MRGELVHHGNPPFGSIVLPRIGDAACRVITPVASLGSGCDPQSVHGDVSHFLTSSGRSMISQTAEHALRAVLYLAGHADEGPLKVEDIARALGAPRNYLSKTMHLLASHGIVTSARGPRGGFVLRVPPDELQLSTLVALFDPPRQRGLCLLGGRPCTDNAPCRAHFQWKQIQEASLAPLRDTTIADLLAE
jgi:Rrf2 family protein